MEAFLTASGLASLATLTLMEIVLGVDNIVFIAILTSKLPADQQKKARLLGLTLALVIRIGLLFAISWVMGLTAELFNVVGRSVSGRDLILLGGGMFLVWKATWEIYQKVELEEHAHEPKQGRGVFLNVLAQILILDIVFSLDSVITAVGMADNLPIMVTAMVISMLVMLVVAKSIADFVERHPSVKILALSFLLLIGVMLIAEGTGGHMSKGYIYAAMAFSLFVEMLNLRYHKKRKAKPAA